jgi:hypothetical protein
MTQNNKADGKAYAIKLLMEVELARGETIRALSPDGHVCTVVPGPWGYRPSYAQSSPSEAKEH